eukprot:GHVP01060652.1.p1 GENE.GHVP01060652.1~~GHVP01060652.1.p1  ORF type:complete len:222 (+),score=49.72 GHVP01060652.1:294-959(+)
MSQFCQKSNMTKNCFNLKDVIAGTALMAVNGCSSNSNLSEAPEESFSSAPQDENVFVKKTDKAFSAYADQSLKAFEFFNPKKFGRGFKVDFGIAATYDEFKALVHPRRLDLVEWVERYLPTKNFEVFSKTGEGFGISRFFNPISSLQKTFPAISMAVNYKTSLASMMFYFPNGNGVQIECYCFQLGTGSELESTILNWLPMKEKEKEEEEEEDGVTLNPIE